MSGDRECLFGRQQGPERVLHLQCCTYCCQGGWPAPYACRLLMGSLIGDQRQVVTQTASCLCNCSMGAAFGAGVCFSFVSGVPNPLQSALTTGAAFAGFNGLFYQVCV